MHTLHRSAYTLAICLSALAGCIDAIGFLQLGGYFISFMSGNSTRLAVNLVNGDTQHVALVAGIILCFVAGGACGSLIRHFARIVPAMSVLAFVTVLLASAAFSHEIGYDALAMALLILAMGAENAVFQRNGEVVVGLTYMTGTLVKVGQRLAGAFTGGAAFSWVPYLLLWIGLITGGAAGTLLFSQWGLHTIWLTAVWAGGLTLLSNRVAHHLPA